MIKKDKLFTIALKSTIATSEKKGVGKAQIGAKDSKVVKRGARIDSKYSIFSNNNNNVG